jgi:hypothetical protein
MSCCGKGNYFFVASHMTERRKTRRDAEREAFAERQKAKVEGKADFKGDVKAAPAPAAKKKELDLDYHTPKPLMEKIDLAKPAAPPTPAKGIDVEKYLEQRAEELHKPVRHTHETRMIFAESKDHTWSCDLVEMGFWKDENDGISYILMCCDVFTRYLWSVPLKTKTAAEVRKAFEKIVKESKRKPQKLFVDEGKEFLGKEMTEWREANGIGIYHVWGRAKSAIVERVNKTIKTWMWKRLTALNSHEWVGLLPGLVHRYNTRKHSKLLMTPEYASEHPEEAMKRWLALLKEIPPPGRPKFRIGQWVRTSRVKGIFEKGHDINWTLEIFRIVGVIEKRPVTYTLRDYFGELIQGSFYEQQLQVVKHPDIFLIDEVLEEKGRGAAKQLLVSFVGYPKKYNRWMLASGTQKV